ncbi:hypothetical protein Taro_051153 [Colocasia esculenta]|uniref:Trichome birefringence-like N-terminal domain-containing protein n=1 Tax=Colocasia esculenta TaxID=4460 RepID=A0A843XG39_COLES|nr:hypothetical protein [Colocasia esculenta]
MKPPSSLRRAPRCRSCLITLSFLVFVGFLYGEDFACVLRQPFQRLRTQPDVPAAAALEHLHPEKLTRGGVFAVEKEDDAARPFAVGSTPRGCDVFAGRWVYDEESRPQYDEGECPYIQPQLTCQEHGRPDRGFQHWRWQPHGCSLPSFNATFMLEMLRGKRMLFVGDSLNRGQFVSMVCLLHRVIPEHAKSMETFDSLTVFTAKVRTSRCPEMTRKLALFSTALHRYISSCRTALGGNPFSSSRTVRRPPWFQEYNATVEFYWAPFLVESNSDDAIVHRITDRIVRAGSIKKHARHWKGADIIVFNTYLWWMTGVPMKILRGSFSGDMKDITRMETEDAFKMALRSMVRWVEKSMDPAKTRVFFATMSPSHEQSTEWGGEPGGNCYNQTSPIEDPSYWGIGSSKGIMRVIGDVFRRSKVPISVLNITQLSEYRKDAHTQIYKKQWNPLTPEQLANPRSYADCVHWCLPGLQDTWNELLYAQLFFP